MVRKKPQVTPKTSTIPAWAEWVSLVLRTLAPWVVPLLIIWLT